MKKRVIACLFATVCAAPVSALAESKAKSSDQSTPDVDTSERAARTLFAQADADGDGRVTYAEFSIVVRQSVEKQVALRFKQLDRNGDGRCTRSEVNKMDAARFARFDLNRDGAFTRVELTQAIGRQLSSRMVRVLAALDRDGDRSMSVAELTPAKKPTKPVDVAGSGHTAGKF